MNAVVQIAQQPTSVVEVHVLTPMSMIEKALASNVSPDTLGKLLDLQDRWEANQARKAFVQNMALAKAKFGPILKKNDGYESRYKYETLPDVMAAIDVPLSDYGFSYDWETEEVEGGSIRVTCVITHETGHSRRNSLVGNPADTASTKANMNGLQRLGSAVSYLQRYTLKAALGLAAEKDTDGRATDRELSQQVTPEQTKEIFDLLTKSKSNEQEMLKYVGAGNTEKMTLQQYAKAKAAMNTKISNQTKATKEPA